MTGSSARTAWSPKRCAGGASPPIRRTGSSSGCFGLELTQAHYDRGDARSSTASIERGRRRRGLERLWKSERELPTPAEVDAPGLWLARIDLPEPDAN